MGWYLSPALVTLRQQVNDLAPGRNKSWDGTIGDAAHAARTSDHNPRPGGEVCALDLTNWPPGFDAHQLAREIAESGDPRWKYSISRSRIKSAERHAEGWRPNTGHTHHSHTSVYPGATGEPWRLPMFGNATNLTPQPPSKDWFDMATKEELRQIVKEEVEARANIDLTILAGMMRDNFATGFNRIAEWTKAMSDLTVKQMKGK